MGSNHGDESDYIGLLTPQERQDLDIFKAKEPMFYETFAWNDAVFRELVHSGVFSQDELLKLKVGYVSVTVYV